ncbi:MAG: hypothetical protein ACREUQ_16100, partial [Burkholderiales bacterium]
WPATHRANDYEIGSCPDTSDLTTLFAFAAIHVLLPIVVLVWHWQFPVSSRGQWLARTLAFVSFFATLHIAGFWLVLPRWVSAAAISPATTSCAPNSLHT